MLARDLAEGLALLGRVDSADADGDLFVGAWLAAAGGQSVTIGDGDDEAEERGCSQIRALLFGEKASEGAPECDCASAGRA